MRVLVLNCGSSSIKYKLFDMSSNNVMAQGGIEKIGLEGSFLKLTDAEGKKHVIEKNIPEHLTGVKLIFDVLTGADYGCIKSLDEIDAVGHRVLHAGEKITKSTIITDEVESVIEECIPLGPLHNPSNLVGIRAVKEILPGKPQVAVFDTAFHQTMPKKAYLYGLPYEYYTKYGIRKYGFHGTSHRYVSGRVCEFLGMPAEGMKLINAHIGNGASMSAVKDGKCIDTSMGLTPLDGLLMGTRSGELDPAALLFIHEKEGLKAKDLDTLLNKKSGLLGLSGVSSDMREVFEAYENGNERAKIALQIYYYRIKKYVGSYAAALGGLDVLLFTGGVGENQSFCREIVCKDMEFLGIKLDKEKNNAVHGDEAVISTVDSKVKVVVIPTDEELMIAKDTVSLI